ncbi:hypothetical protein IFM89_023150 [Coptis chinensis]|uniref:Myb-like domain-containing protein n=1 Tax=Coptis chinensis TaxID=261450 RepID=A0A835IPU7_9MAGN|nr:hypothetical protein IFM89_023150 [Coptis chinensis]
MLVSKNDAVGRKEEKKRKHKSKEVVNGEEKKGCDGKEVQKEKKRNKSKEEENNSVDVEGKEKKKKKKKRSKSNDGVHGKKSHKDKESLGLSKDERESDHDVELEVKKDKKRKKEKRDKSKDGSMTLSSEEILNDEEKENNLVTESNREEGNSSDKGYTSLEERKGKDKKKKKKKGGDIEPLMMNNSNNLSAKESNEKDDRSVDVEVEEGNTLDTEKKKKKKKKKKNFPREILENSSDIEKTPLCDNDPNSNEGHSGSVAKRKRKRSREKEALPGKNINKGETRRKKKTGSADGAENTETRKSSKRVKFSEKVEVFPLLDVTDIEKENKEKGLVRGKRFSLEEDVIIKDAVFKFIKEHDLGDDGIEMVLRCTSMPWRTKESIYNRAHLLFESDGKRKWTPEELETIKKFVLCY